MVVCSNPIVYIILQPFSVINSTVEYTAGFVDDVIGAKPYYTRQ